MKIPVNIISGFLGSGKTTAIIQLLSQKANNEQWAIVINEFGKISIDGQTLRSNSHAGAIFDISGGCICCSAKGYFTENLDQIILSGNYDRIIIEPSGLGGIEMISEIVEVDPRLQLMPIVCLVDITCIENSRFQRNPIYRMQISKSNIIAFTKCDLIEENLQLRLIDQFKTNYPDKQKSIVQLANLFLELIDSESLLKMEGCKYKMVSDTNLHLTDDNYQKFNFQFNSDQVFDTEKLIQFINSHPSIIRAKGFFQTETGWYLFNYTLSGTQFEPCLPKLQNELVIIAEKADDHFNSNSILECSRL